jgi:hypothetical protein
MSFWTRQWTNFAGSNAGTFEGAPMTMLTYQRVESYTAPRSQDPYAGITTTVGHTAAVAP